jgi:hypothetical protein
MCHNHSTVEKYIKRNPNAGLSKPTQFQEFEGPRFQDNRHVKVVSFSALRTGRLYPQGIPVTHFWSKLSRQKGHSATRNILSMKAENRTRDLLACNAMPQPTAPSVTLKIM